jgi:nickel-type superoxide dismutase maturation protease
MKNGLRKANWKDSLRFYIGFPDPLLAIKVSGNSMSPAINADEVMLYDPSARLEVGDIVLTAHPFMQSVKIVKRIAEIDADGMVTLAGDNPAESTDSRTLGKIPIKSIKGRIVCKWK